MRHVTRGYIMTTKRINTINHFSVAVFSDGRKTVEELLAPYQENNMDNCPPQYLEFVSATESEREKYETGEFERVCLADGSYMSPWDEKQLTEAFSSIKYNDGKDHSAYFGGKSEYLILNSSAPFPGDAQIIFDLGEKGAKLQKVPYKEVYPTLQEFVRDYIEAPWDEGKQDYGYWKNPNAKWDWWQKGGRWDKLLKTVSGERCMEAKVADIDFVPDPQDYLKHCRWWEVVVDGAPLTESERTEDFFTTCSKEYPVAHYRSREAYAEVQSSVITHAVITPDGKWHQRGDAGWPGTESPSAEEFFEWNMRFREIFIDSADPDWTLTIVDCHI